MNSISQKLFVKEKIGYRLGDLAANLVFQTLMTYLVEVQIEADLKETRA
jgi:GPH family glycoside/pentoside/hexuronide:cation symporter